LEISKLLTEPIYTQRAQVANSDPAKIGQLAKKNEKLREALLAYHLLNRIKNDQEEELFEKAERALE
jgi:hypothetical protein